MNVFEEFTSLCMDFSVCRTAFLDAHERAKAVMVAVKDRLEAERAQAAERIAALEQQQGDPARSETVRRMAALELDRLKSLPVPSVTAEERAVFLEEYNGAVTALRDLGELRAKIREAIDAVNAEVKRLRGETLGQDMDLCGRWIERIQRDFDRLGG